MKLHDQYDAVGLEIMRASAVTKYPDTWLTWLAELDTHHDALESELNARTQALAIEQEHMDRWKRIHGLAKPYRLSQHGRAIR